MADTLADLVGPKGLPPGDPTAAVGRNLFDGTFPLPTAVLRERALADNIATMATYVREHDVLLAPHAKTTMSPQIVRRQLAAGAWGMTVATAWQAVQVARMGVDRILVANQVTDPGSLALLEALLSRCPALTIWVYVDSAESLDAISSVAAPRSGSLRLLLEVGFPGGRTGVRSVRQALDVARLATRRPHPLAGVSGFEGNVSAPDVAETIARVDRFLGVVGDVAAELVAADLVASGEPMVTLGGSSYPDRVVAVLAERSRAIGLSVVLRSGCYVTHDHGAYAATSPFGEHPRAPFRLSPAIEAWGSVLSRPEPGLALVGLGRRDVSFDAGLPVVTGRRSHQDAGAPAPVVTALNDQHAYLAVDPLDPLTVGDLVSFGISHPCTTFDKWHAMPVVDDEYTVVDVVTTEF